MGFTTKLWTEIENDTFIESNLLYFMGIKTACRLLITSCRLLSIEIDS